MRKFFTFFTQLRSSYSIGMIGTNGKFLRCASIGGDCCVDHVCVPALSRTVVKRIKTPTGYWASLLRRLAESVFKRPLLCNFTVKQATSPLRSRTAGQDPPFYQRSKPGSGQRSSCVLSSLHCTPLSLPPHLAGIGPSSAFLSLRSFSSLYV
jgi:hypothetical protein